MGIATKKWTDENRFNQTGYSASTLFPLEEDYQDQEAFKADLKSANYREESREEWLDELRMEAREEMMAEACCEYDDCEDWDCDE